MFKNPNRIMFAPTTPALSTQTTQTTQTQAKQRVPVKTAMHILKKAFQAVEMTQEKDFFGTQINAADPWYSPNNNFIKTMAEHFQQLIISSQKGVEDVLNRLLSAGRNPLQVFRYEKALVYTPNTSLTISIEDYLLKLKPLAISVDNLINSFMCLKRYFAYYQNEGLFLSNDEIDSYLLATLIMNTKLENDSSYKNSDFAQVTALPLKRINALERNFFAAIGAFSYVSPDVFAHYQYTLLSLAVSKGLIDPYSYSAQVEKLSRWYYAYTILKHCPADEESAPRIGEPEITESQQAEITEFQKVVGWNCFVSKSRIIAYRQFDFKKTVQQLGDIADKPLLPSNDTNQFSIPFDLKSRISLSIASTLARKSSELEDYERYKKTPITFTEGDILKPKRLSEPYYLIDLFGKKVNEHGFIRQKPSEKFIGIWIMYFTNIISAHSNKAAQLEIEELPEPKDPVDIANIEERMQNKLIMLFEGMELFLYYLIENSLVNSTALLGMFALLSRYTQKDASWLMQLKTIYYNLLGSFLTATKILDKVFLHDEYMAKLIGIKTSEIKQMQSAFQLDVNSLVPEDFSKIKMEKWERFFLSEFEDELTPMTIATSPAVQTPSPDNGSNSLVSMSSTFFSGPTRPVPMKGQGQASMQLS